MRAGAITLAVLLGATAGLVAVGQRAAPAPRFLVRHDWVPAGRWIRADTHMHTRASDGGLTVAQLVERARANGCEAVAITDHAALSLRAATPQYMTDIAAARAAHPGMPIAAGVEWNVPPSNGNEHATVLVAEHPAEGEVLASFKQRFDHADRTDGVTPDAGEALRWLATATTAFPVPPVVVYNHPSRRDAASLGNADDLVRWRSVNDLVIGFEGAPGHQGKPPIGSYQSQQPAIDRWDPVVARPGDGWDVVLQRGLDASGAIATSDFHNDNPRDLNDFLPCEFAETWYQVPEVSVSGLLRAMRAGTFYGVHGHIARDVSLQAAADRLPRPAAPGEVIEVPAGTVVTVRLSFTVPEIDWEGRANRVDAVEMIAITRDDVRVGAHVVSGTGAQRVADTFIAGTGGLVVRARLRRTIDDGPDLMAYTNAIRIAVR